MRADVAARRRRSGPRTGLGVSGWAVDVGRARDGFGGLLGLRPRNLLAFLFFLVSALALLMVILVIVAYAGLHVDALRGLATVGPADGVKVIIGLLEFFVFLWFRLRSVRKTRRAARREPEREEAERAEAVAEL